MTTLGYQYQAARLTCTSALPNAEIARCTGTSLPTMVDWRARYDAGGIRALEDQPRSGRPPRIDEIAVVVATLADEGRPPARWPTARPRISTSRRVPGPGAVSVEEYGAMAKRKTGNGSTSGTVTLHPDRTVFA